MTQSDVMDILKANPNKWWTSKQLALILNTNAVSITANLKNLRKYNMIKHKSGMKKNIYLYKYKHPNKVDNNE